ncbi:MAG: cytochrome c family protein [Lautropia sp.]
MVKLRIARAGRMAAPSSAPSGTLAAAGLIAAGLVAGCSAAADTAAAERRAGRELLEQYQCGRCHRIPGVAAARGDLAVTLERFGRRSYIAGRLPNTTDNLHRWLIDPDAVVPGTLMPNLGVDPADARRMAAYLASLD